ncbi:MAG: GHKL domain-containing protein [Candidatus Didemnitutus sp.]|nr:GHKL domain-containing protein [Candidatus Didemnitutus sp.]
MIYFAAVALLVAFLFTLRLLVRQNRLLEQLRGAIRFEQPHLNSEGRVDHLPEWPALAEDVNRLIAEKITLQQQRTDQLTQLEATLGNLREAVLIVDEANYIHLANRALREIFPASRDLVNLRLELIVRSAAFLDYVRATRAGQPLPRQEFEINQGAGSTWIEASGAPIPSPDGKSQWALFVIHDMTQQRILERMRRDFVANASHELRTPLSVIKGYVETLVDGHATMTDDERAKFLGTIQRHSDRLNAIIADLLTLSRLESATPGVNFEAIDLRVLLTTLVDDTAARPNARRHALASRLDDALGDVSGDAEKLTQLFGNLLDNAVKYCPAGAQIVVEGRALPSTGEVEIVVRDTGPGIPAEDLPHIFERFYRVEKGRSRESGGTGLGLSIVKHIAQLHGGRVWAESEAGQGTAIFVRLPCATPKAS